MKVKAGDRVMLTVGDQTVAATVILASPNGRSLMFTFDAILDGHVGMMPVLRCDDGVYRALISDSVVTINYRI